MGESCEQGELAVWGTEPEWDGIAEVVRRRAAALGDDLLEVRDYRVEPHGVVGAARGEGLEAAITTYQQTVSELT